jgi:hypothetical protein
LINGIKRRSPFLRCSVVHPRANHVQVEVVDVRSHPDGFEVVLFRHPNCLARGRWNSRHRAEKRRAYSVEFDLKEPIGMLQPVDAGSRYPSGEHRQDFGAFAEASSSPWPPRPINR